MSKIYLDRGGEGGWETSLPKGSLWVGERHITISGSFRMLVPIYRGYLVQAFLAVNLDLNIPNLVKMEPRSRYMNKEKPYYVKNYSKFKQDGTPL